MLFQCLGAVLLSYQRKLSKRNSFETLKPDYVKRLFLEQTSVCLVDILDHEMVPIVIKCPYLLLDCAFNVVILKCNICIINEMHHDEISIVPSAQSDQA